MKRCMLVFLLAVFFIPAVAGATATISNVSGNTTTFSLGTADLVSEVEVIYWVTVWVMFLSALGLIGGVSALLVELFRLKKLHADTAFMYKQKRKWPLRLCVSAAALIVLGVLLMLANSIVGFFLLPVAIVFALIGSIWLNLVKSGTDEMTIQQQNPGFEKIMKKFNAFKLIVLIASCSLLVLFIFYLTQMFVVQQSPSSIF